MNQFITNIKRSKIYETAPWGKIDQDDFLNMCISGETNLTPLELLKTVKEIEKKVGRKEREIWGPREIDLDIIAYKDLILKTKDLTIPHPYLTERQFVLLPLSDIAGDWIHPLLKQNIQELSDLISKDDVKLFNQD